jgi:hypothetical protein
VKKSGVAAGTTVSGVAQVQPLHRRNPADTKNDPWRPGVEQILNDPDLNA